MKEQLKKVMTLAWQFIKQNGMSKSEALKKAWVNIKLHLQLSAKVVKFHFTKVDGTLREAYGTLKENLLPPTQGTRKANQSIQVYFDTEKQEYRCFKKANLVSIG